jgi:hypothetical protein
VLTEWIEVALALAFFVLWRLFSVLFPAVLGLRRYLDRLADGAGLWRLFSVKLVLLEALFFHAFFALFPVVLVLRRYLGRLADVECFWEVRESEVWGRLLRLSTSVPRG